MGYYKEAKDLFPGVYSTDIGANRLSPPTIHAVARRLSQDIRRAGVDIPSTSLEPVVFTDPDTGEAACVKSGHQPKIGYRPQSGIPFSVNTFGAVRKTTLFLRENLR